MPRTSKVPVLTLPPLVRGSTPRGVRRYDVVLRVLRDVWGVVRSAQRSH